VDTTASENTAGTFFLESDGAGGYTTRSFNDVPAAISGKIYTQQGRFEQPDTLLAGAGTVFNTGLDMSQPGARLRFQFDETGNAGDGLQVIELDLETAIARGTSFPAVRMQTRSGGYASITIEDPATGQIRISDTSLDVRFDWVELYNLVDVDIAQGPQGDQGPAGDTYDDSQVQADLGTLGSALGTVQTDLDNLETFVASLPTTDTDTVYDDTAIVAANASTQTDLDALEVLVATLPTADTDTVYDDTALVASVTAIEDSLPPTDGEEGQVVTAQTPSGTSAWSYPYGFGFQQSTVSTGVTITQSFGGPLPAGHFPVNSLQQAPAVAGLYEVMVTGSWAHNSISNDISMDIFVDGGDTTPNIPGLQIEPKDSAGTPDSTSPSAGTDQVIDFSRRFYAQLADGDAPLWEWGMKPLTNGVAATVHESVITVMRVSD